MYIRRTHTRSNATGEPYFTYRLVRSESIDGKVKQVTLLNLGRHFAVDQSLWPALCVRINELLAVGGYPLKAEQAGEGRNKTTQA